MTHEDYKKEIIEKYLELKKTGFFANKKEERRKNDEEFKAKYGISFFEKFGIESISLLKGKDLLYHLFQDKDDSTNSIGLTRALEYYMPDYGSFTGTDWSKSPASYSANKKYPEQGRLWRDFNGNAISEGEAIKIAEKTKEKLIQLYNYLKNGDLESFYQECPNDRYYRFYHKYLYMFYPDILTSYHSKDFAKNHKVKLNLHESQKLALEKYFWEIKKQFNLSDVYVDDLRLTIEELWGVGIAATTFDQMKPKQYRPTEICKQNSNKEQDMTKIPLNQILYGPPGTGKTYNTVIKAMEIIGIKEVFYNWYCKNSNAMNKDKTFKDYDAAIEVIKRSFNINLYNIIDKDEFGAIKSNIVNSIEFQKELKHAKTSQGTSYYESALNQYEKFLCSVKYVDFKEYFNKLKQQGQIEFVTFHQSYSYEEFVEGIKPDLENGKELRYKLQNGIFKTICNNAKELLETKVKYNFNKDNISVYKILIPDESLFAYCIENDCVAINWGNDIDISNCDSQEEIIAKIPEDFESRKQCISQLNLFKLWIDNDLKSGKDVIVVIPGSMNTIKGIAKITGDYFYNSDIENGHQQRKVDWIRKNINISSDNIYNSKFVSPTITGMFNDKINWDTFLNLINNKNNSKSSNAVLVIDEINRGDVSKIFGELITLIEEDKRIGKEHQMTVTLPYSREPFGVPNNLYIIGTMNTVDRSIALLDTALRRRFDFEEMMPKPELLRGKDIEGVDLEQLLTQINDRIKNEYDRDHQIGHSYLIGVKDKEDLERAYKNRILPLLNEYFYNDINTVAKILNCKPNEITSKENWFNVLKEAQKPTKKDNEQ